MKNTTFILIISCLTFIAFGQKKKDKSKENQTNLFKATDLSALSFRSIGPALTSGRVSDIAVHPKSHDTWYVAAASGGLWYTDNHGITFAPIFDQYSSYSIACVEIAPSNPNVLWVGTGENNNQRSVSYGDGVYKSLDGGKTFENMGLKNSEHIGSIVIHPEDQNIIWIAAYGPLWSKGGDRGVYKSKDGGKTWDRTLFISDNTGVSEIAIDPSDPNILYASAHQRRRREWTYIGGGPESGLYKSTDGGLTWKEINNGLPKGEMGRIGIAVAPSNPDVIYAIAEGKYDKGGFFKSVNKGETWVKQSNYSTSGNYYQEIMVDPKNQEKVFSMNTYLHHTMDGGKTFVPTGEKGKHVDNHAIWIDPHNTDHWLVGCDGGIYETYTHAAQWRYYSNLPITQFYKVATDNAAPFYHVYGGTQDNNSMGGPSNSNNVAGILNTDWYITNGGDGFESAIDWSNSNIIYAQAQYGWLVRYDKSSGEKVPIQPMPKENEAGYRWNWDAPILVSSHDAKTIYFAANKVFKSENRGDDWETISPDLSQQLDRNKLPVMGQVWSIDAVMKNASTTIYGNIVAMDESPIQKGLLYVGTDDGLIQVTEDDGKNWTKYNEFPGVPKNTRVNSITADLFDVNKVYAVFNSQRSGDFKPYILVSQDKGKSWKHIESDLPERGNSYCLKQDHIQKELLFVGTEFGAFFSNNAGENWHKLSGLPTIAIYDLDIQKRENDLVAASFGRGFYVLDDYSPLRSLSKENLSKKAYAFPISPALLYVLKDPMGLEGTGFQGHNLYKAPNSSFGAVFSFYLNDEFESKKSKRKKRESKLEKEGKDVSYPSFSELRKEKQEFKPKLLVIVSDSDKNEIRRMSLPVKKGLNRVVWDLRTNSTNLVGSKGKGFLVTPGDYYFAIYKIDVNNQSYIDTLIENKKFSVVGLNNQTLLAQNQKELKLFRLELLEINRNFEKMEKEFKHIKNKLDLMLSAVVDEANGPVELTKEINNYKISLDIISIKLFGDRLRSSNEFETSPSLSERFGMLQYKLYSNTAGVTKSHRSDLDIVQREMKINSEEIEKIKSKIVKMEELMKNRSMPFFKN